MRGENSTLRYDLPGYSPVYPKIFSIIVLKMGGGGVTCYQNGLSARSLLSVNMMYNCCLANI
jgi:hypothetical protein